jgi:hypothetical protein
MLRPRLFVGSGKSAEKAAENAQEKIDAWLAEMPEDRIDCDEIISGYLSTTVAEITGPNRSELTYSCTVMLIVD